VEQPAPSGRSASLVLTPDTPSSATTLSTLNPGLRGLRELVLGGLLDGTNTRVQNAVGLHDGPHGNSASATAIALLAGLFPALSKPVV
jgi:hypothetical protein